MYRDNYSGTYAYVCTSMYVPHLQLLASKGVEIKMSAQVEISWISSRGARSRITSRVYCFVNLNDVILTLVFKNSVTKLYETDVNFGGAYISAIRRDNNKSNAMVAHSQNLLQLPQDFSWFVVQYVDKKTLS